MFLFFGLDKSPHDCSSKTATITADNIDLTEFLNDLGEKIDVQFYIYLKKPILIKQVNFEQTSLKNILDFLSESFDLKCTIGDNSVTIQQNEEYWTAYSLKFFFEDSLPNLSSFFDKQNQENKGATSSFWQEIEKNISSISRKHFSIDKYNGIINIFGSVKTHKEVVNYLTKVFDKLYHQVLIECKVVEVSTSIGHNVDLNPILAAIRDDFALSSLTNCIQQFVLECRKLYTNIQIKTSTDIHMLLMSQHTGRMLSSKIDFFQEQEILNTKKNYGRRDRKPISLDYSDTISTHYEKNEHGFSFTVVPLILDDNTILLKLRPSISTLQNETGSINNHEPQNVQRREFNTVIKTKSGVNHILGGLYIEYDIEETKEATKIPLLRHLLNKKQIVRQKSYFILFIKVTIC